MKAGLLRGKLLKLLYDMYPDSMEHGSIVGIYYQYHPVGVIKRALEYLHDKGMVVQSSAPHPYREGASVVYYRISPLGVDLVEGNASRGEPGILLPVEDGRG